MSAIRYNPDRGDKPAWLNREATDQKIVAKRQWQAGSKARKPQLPCDVGLFSDEADQLDLVEMFQDPVDD